jgi:CHRD domain
MHLCKLVVPGNVLVALCSGNCHSGITRTATMRHRILDELEAGKSYVNVHTAKNPNREIRGQIRVSS